MSQRNRLPAPVEPDLPGMDNGMTFDQLQAMNGVNMTEEDVLASGMAPDAVANDVAAAEPEVRRAEPAMQPTGAFMDLGFIQSINNAATDEEATAMYNALDPVQKRVYDRSYGINISPEWAAGEASKFYEEQDERAKAANPTKEAADKAALAGSQLALQDAYLQEMEYQSHLNTVNNPQASRAERQAAISAIDGLATAIGKRTMGSGAGSRDAMTAGKKAVGFIDWRQEYNPFVDYTPQVDVMRRGSDNRLGTIRQQMESAGVPVPEFKGAAAAPQANPSQMVLERFGVKASDGNPVMLNGSPVVSFKRGGKDVMMRQTPNGGFVELTAEEAAALRGQ